MKENKVSEYKKSICLLLCCCFFNLCFAQLKTGAERMELYLPLLKGKKTGLVVNQTSMVGKRHLVDTLLKLNVNVKCIFAPEHGFRGNVSAGEKVASGIDPLSKLPIVSLYGNNKKPKAEQLKKLDVILFDIQDVGARFYTYISTLHYVMEACAENGKTLVLLDRPNPNGFYVDGPLLDTAYRSFVGMHPVPVVHGMTIGEYAQMINGEGWLKNGMTCKLKIIGIHRYQHETKYVPPVYPSPNLKTIESIYLYPSLCFFEGTRVSLGRGTDKPFECLGKPGSGIGNYSFTPRNIPGVAENPPFKDTLCTGYLLTDYARNFASQFPGINLYWLIEFYKKDKSNFFNGFFDTLAGGQTLRKQIEQGLSEAEIRESWKEGLDTFRKTRKKYLMYAETVSY